VGHVQLLGVTIHRGAEAPLFHVAPISVQTAGPFGRSKLKGNPTQAKRGLGWGTRASRLIRSRTFNKFSQKKIFWL
jgi:hypothetical protein